MLKRSAGISRERFFENAYPKKINVRYFLAGVKGDGTYHAPSTKNGEHDRLTRDDRRQPSLVLDDGAVHHPVDISELLERGLHLQLQRSVQPRWLLAGRLQLHGTVGGRLEQHRGQQHHRETEHDGARIG